MAKKQKQAATPPPPLTWVDTLNSYVTLVEETAGGLLASASGTSTADYLKAMIPSRIATTPEVKGNPNSKKRDKAAKQDLAKKKPTRKQKGTQAPAEEPPRSRLSARAIELRIAAVDHSKKSSARLGEVLGCDVHEHTAAGVALVVFLVLSVLLLICWSKLCGCAGCCSGAGKVQESQEAPAVEDDSRDSPTAPSTAVADAGPDSGDSPTGVQQETSQEDENDGEVNAHHVGDNVAFSGLAPSCEPHAPPAPSAPTDDDASREEKEVIGFEEEKSSQQEEMAAFSEGDHLKVETSEMATEATIRTDESAAEAVSASGADGVAACDQDAASVVSAAGIVDKSARNLQSAMDSCVSPSENNNVRGDPVVVSEVAEIPADSALNAAAYATSTTGTAAADATASAGTPAKETTLQDLAVQHSGLAAEAAFTPTRSLQATESPVKPPTPGSENTAEKKRRLSFPSLPNPFRSKKDKDKDKANVAAASAAESTVSPSPSPAQSDTSNFAETTETAAGKLSPIPDEERQTAALQTSDVGVFVTDAATAAAAAVTVNVNVADVAPPSTPVALIGAASLPPSPPGRSRGEVVRVTAMLPTPAEESAVSEAVAETVADAISNVAAVPEDTLASSEEVAAAPLGTPITDVDKAAVPAETGSPPDIIAVEGGAGLGDAAAPVIRAGTLTEALPPGKEEGMLLADPGEAEVELEEEHATVPQAVEAPVAAAAAMEGGGKISGRTAGTPGIVDTSTDVLDSVLSAPEIPTTAEGVSPEAPSAGDPNMNVKAAGEAAAAAAEAAIDKAMDFSATTEGKTTRAVVGADAMAAAFLAAGAGAVAAGVETREVEAAGVFTEELYDDREVKPELGAAGVGTDVSGEKDVDHAAALAKVGVLPLEHVPGAMSAGPASAEKTRQDVSPAESKTQLTKSGSSSSFFRRKREKTSEGGAGEEGSKDAASGSGSGSKKKLKKLISLKSFRRTKNTEK